MRPGLVLSILLHSQTVANTIVVGMLNLVRTTDTDLYITANIHTLPFLNGFMLYCATRTLWTRFQTSRLKVWVKASRKKSWLGNC
jgi:hypothetical protein